MEATDTLMAEHRVIEGVLQALAAAADALERGQAVRPGFFTDGAAFAAGFADDCHHKKEEGVLFPTMIAHGVPEQAGPIPVMLAEHARGRQYIRELRAAAARLEAGEPAAGEVVAQARGYVMLLSQHIAKEDRILFPMAGKVIPANEQPAVSQAFEKVEHEEAGAGVHERYLALAAALKQEAARFLSLELNRLTSKHAP